MEKIRTVSSHIPEEMDAKEAKQKLIKLIFDVFMHQLEEMSEGIPVGDRAEKLDKAIRLVYLMGWPIHLLMIFWMQTSYLMMGKGNIPV